MRVTLHSSPAKSSLPSWQTLVNKRNEELSSLPTLQRDDQPPNMLPVEDVSPKEVALHQEYCPLSKAKSAIEYNPSEDDMAARMYGLRDNCEAERRHSSTRNLDLHLGSDAEPNHVSGYHFEELIRE